MKKTTKTALVLACLDCLRLLKAVGAAPASLSLAAALPPNGQHGVAGSLHPLRALGTLLLTGSPSAAYNSAASPQSAAIQRQSHLRHPGAEMRTGASMLPPEFSIRRDFHKLQNNQIHFIAADPGMMNTKASSGTGASKWGLWKRDPNRRAWEFSDYITELKANAGKAKEGSKLDPEELWIQENGRIMFKPILPIPDGTYCLPWLNGGNAGRPVVLNISGDTWELDKRSGATLLDVTHLPCRSARYTRVAEDALPTSANVKDFPVNVGGKMPAISGYSHVDYAVLFVEALGKDPSKEKPKKKKISMMGGLRREDPKSENGALLPKNKALRQLRKEKRKAFLQNAMQH